jgi:PhzF family phenazine biosynthesis protein
MRTRAYREIDVFTGEAYRGNALAVVLDAADLDAERMQQFARWTNLSETSFLLPASDPQADYRVRIFTPTSELPFAGHPSLGTCHAWLETGGVPRQSGRIVQQCALGRVALRREGSALAFCAPPMQKTAVPPHVLETVRAALGLPGSALRAAQWLQNGPRWLGLLVDSAATVLALEPDHGRLRSLANVGLIGPYGAGGPADFEVRAFADPENIPEDPVTGSLNAALGQWLIAEGLLPTRYLVSQGTRLQRAGRVTVTAQDGAVWVSGSSVTCVEGTVQL